MEFIVHQPSRLLQPFIQCYLEGDFRNTEEDGEHMLFPNGFSGLVFNFGERSSTIIHEEYPSFPVTVFGQIDRHFKARHSAGFYSIAIIMKPTILSWLLRINMAEITNKVVDAMQFNS